jgi:hypothetical protein
LLELSHEPGDGGHAAAAQLVANGSATRRDAVGDQVGYRLLDIFFRKGLATRHQVLR